MKHLILVPIAALGLTACETREETIAAGAAAGAAIAGEGDLVEGAIIGAIVGATYEYVRRDDSDPDKCLYRNVETGRYVWARCAS